MDRRLHDNEETSWSGFFLFIGYMSCILAVVYGYYQLAEMWLQ